MNSRFVFRLGVNNVDLTPVMMFSGPSLAEESIIDVSPQINQKGQKQDKSGRS